MIFELFITSRTSVYLRFSIDFIVILRSVELLLVISVSWLFECA